MKLINPVWISRPSSKPLVRYLSAPHYLSSLGFLVITGKKLWSQYRVGVELMALNSIRSAAMSAGEKADAEEIKAPPGFRSGLHVLLW